MPIDARQPIRRRKSSSDRQLSDSNWHAWYAGDVRTRLWDYSRYFLWNNTKYSLVGATSWFARFEFYSLVVVDFTGWNSTSVLSLATFCLSLVLDTLAALTHSHTSDTSSTTDVSGSDARLTMSPLRRWCQDESEVRAGGEHRWPTLQLRPNGGQSGTTIVRPSLPYPAMCWFSPSPSRMVIVASSSDSLNGCALHSTPLCLLGYLSVFVCIIFSLSEWHM